MKADDEKLKSESEDIKTLISLQQAHKKEGDTLENVMRRLRAKYQQETNEVSTNRK